MVVLNPLYDPIFTTKKRYIILTGGRGSSKSFTASTFLCLLSYELDHVILFTRYTMSAAEISIIPEFKEKIDLLEVPNQFKIKEKEIVNRRTSSEILFRGIKTSSGNQTANLKSINGLTTFVVDEGEEFQSEEDFDTIDLSVRTNKNQNRIIIIMNPSTQDHWVYKRFFQNNSRIEMVDGLPVEISTHPEVLHIHTTYLDNLHNLNPAFVKRILDMKATSEKLYGHKALGQWLKIAEGALFGDLKTYLPAENTVYDGAMAYIDIADEGTDFLCMVVGKNVKDIIHVPEVVFSESNTDITLPQCAEVIKRHKIKYCRVESNSMGAMFGRNLQKLVPDCQILLTASTTHKHTRILMSSNDINHYMRFLPEAQRDAMYSNYMKLMALYTKDGKCKQDDAPDATSGLMIFIQSMLSHLY